MKLTKLTPILSMLLLLVLLVSSTAACAKQAQSTETAAKKESQKETEKVAETVKETEAATAAEASSGKAKKACLITTSPLGNEFTNLIWSGFEELKKEGWEVKCIEVSEAAEYPDQIRAMAKEGYTAMFTMFDELSEVALSLADELKENYPDLHVFMLDTYMEHDKSNFTSVSVDPFESSFVAGYIAANMTKKKEVGWIGHKDILKIQRFRDGYTAGVNYANNGVKVISAFTGDPFDPIKGQETAKAMIQNNDIDIIYQTDYLGGPGVISACAEAGIKCIGVDDWQGYIDPCVFWSAVKPMNVAVVSLAHDTLKNRQFPTALDFNLSSGGAVYDKRDEKNIPPELLEKVKNLISEIKEGKIDVFKGYDNYRLKY